MTTAAQINHKRFSAVWEKARTAGMEAGSNFNPTPMVVSEADVFGGRKPGGQSWYVSEGVCGFAWVKVTPGTSAFAKWLVKNKIARKAYNGGVDIWISWFNQSMERKTAMAEAMAKVFRDELGINAYGDSRMD